MKRLADCRLCRHFIKADSWEWHKLPDDEKKRAYILAYRRGEKLLGYCLAYRRGVTYYRGTCPRYSPKRETDEHQLSLDKFLPTKERKWELESIEAKQVGSHGLAS